MRFEVYKIIYPEGEDQEISHRLRFNQMVDVNGNPIPLPLRTPNMIVYRIYKISHLSTRNEEITNYHLELVWREELEGYVR